ncbi:hypothetical protein JST56_04545 [Candidatus Dependentiae bacterium]|jgi:predicted NUDIX family phosphoesterase|nr:hypothetical protein [Candidatus Dependentiae bacterium]
MTQKNENILVVPRAKIFTDQPFHGFLPCSNFDAYQNIVEEHKQFLPRSEMEQDLAYKQIIPYLVFTHDNKFFLMQRAGTAGEQRLKNKYTLGIGGHVRESDLTRKTIFDWAIREFQEEIEYDGSLSIQPLGLINDDTNPVGQVHVGFAFLLRGDSPHIAIRSELKHGSLLSLEACAEFVENMETWSQFAFAHLQAQGL